jgi:oxidase EvaA
MQSPAENVFTASSTHARAFLRSTLVIHREAGALHSLEKALEWVAKERASMGMRVRRIPFSEMGAWRFSAERPLRIVHETGRFFAVEGMRFQTRTEYGWHQPILDQPEVGLLGFLATELNGILHFLVQIKWEPGNREAQLSPTVQATHSNYTRAHGGHAQRYIEYFQNPSTHSVMFDALMPEHGFHFVAKFNRNMVVAAPPDTIVQPGFIWMTLGQLRTLVGRDSVVHMDTRSVLGCLPLHAPENGVRSNDVLARNADEESIVQSAHELASVESAEEWLRGVAAAGRIDRQLESLDELEGWTLDDDALFPNVPCPRNFSIVGVEVEATKREVSWWTQPLISRMGASFLGLLCERRNGVVRFLVQAGVEPGYGSSSHLFPTVMCDDVPNVNPWEEAFGLKAPGVVLLSVRNSDEGGRFLVHDERYEIVDLFPDALVEEPPSHRWLTLGELAELGRRGRVSIELRNLLAGLRISDNR